MTILEKIISFYLHGSNFLNLLCNHKELISGEDKRNTIHVFVLVRGLIVLSRMEKFEGEWHWTTDEPTYWMIIPELPK